MDNKIKIKKILSILQIILANIEKDNIDGEIPLIKDFYWVIEPENMFNIDVPPPNINAGQLYDDYEELIKINLFDLIDFDLMKVTALLNYIYFYQTTKDDNS